MSDTNKIRERYQELLGLVEKHNYHYYNLDKPLVDDAEYDRLMSELTDIERKYPSLKIDDSPTERVGGFVSETFSEAPHDPPMMSLGNVFTEEELMDFDERCRKNLDNALEIEYCAELKFDGLAVEVIYENGKYVKGSTRGNGVVGEDISANIATLNALPLRLSGKDIPALLSLRGEVFMRHAEFERLNKIKEEKGEAPFANPRNAAAGSLRQLNPAITEERALDAAFYSIGKIEGGPSIINQRDMYDLFNKYKIPVSEHIKFGKVDELNEFYRYWMENRHNLDFDIDGVVIKVSDFSIRDKLGATSKAPRWATAWKFPAKEAITVLKSVDFQVGRTGLITPVANLDPINIGGVLVKRATLHNFQEVGRLDIRTGDSIKVKRAGDVIPKVVDVIKEKRPPEASAIEPPVKCPSCGTGLKKEEIYIRCVNPDCEAKKLEQMKFFVSKNAMDIDSFGPELIMRLYNAGIINSAADIFKLSREDLLKVERMGDILADKIISAINQKRRISLSHFLKSLGIRNVGEHIAKVIATEVGSLDDLKEKSVLELSGIYEIGPEVAESVYKFFHEPDTRKIIEDILKSGVVVMYEAAGETVIEGISGKTFVFTGSLSRLSRKEAEEMVEKAGGRAAGSVSSKTDYVVAGESAGSKLEKANKLGVAVIGEDEFLKMAGYSK